ncbi:MAG: hypothetical protein AAEJ52_22950 [Myxococcota bacterium]
MAHKIRTGGMVALGVENTMIDGYLEGALGLTAERRAQLAAQVLDPWSP